MSELKTGDSIVACFGGGFGGPFDWGGVAPGGGPGGGPERKCVKPTWDLRVALNAASFLSKLTGVTYFAGLQGSFVASNFAGATPGGSAVFATDPQGNQALVLSTSLGATIGTPGFGGGLQIGAATFQNLNGFLGNSFGGEASAGYGLVVGGGYSNNSSGTATYANVSLAAGENADVSPKNMSTGWLLIYICR